MGYDLAQTVREQLRGQAAPAGERDIESITAEIIQRKQNAGREILAIGNCLIEAKAMLSHGEWSAWLEERVEFSERTATRFMRLAREWTNQTALSDLGATKALTLLALPPEERDSFMAENNVVDMTSRELEKAIRERDEARRAAEAAQADARSAEESRAKMEADMKALEEIHRSAQEGEAQARDALAKARAELKELRERPVEVAVEADLEAVEKARAEAAAEMQARVDAAEKARKEAEKRLKAAEGSLKDARKHAGDNAAAMVRAEKAEAELAEARRQLEAAAKAEKASAVNQNGDLALFNVIFNQTQEGVNKMHGLRLKLGKGDEELDAKLKTAINALADNVRRCAE
ncbi:DUF3102 domain-containing protein [uncultured Oscillibacter sp.]|uniref:DUF3102 domain-containing protein n=1 Tax=uncultured Oscillibacter sp. TaxID=876091 RepID=UPI002618B5BC|nr:DUF3102 domain-containing protein [uncultured Oscillibacter sp.]